MKFIERWNNLSYMWTNGILDTLPDSFTDNISPRKFYKKLILLCKDVTADFLRVFKRTELPDSSIWFFVLTKNNYDALKPIKENIPGSIFVTFFRFRSRISDDTFSFHLGLRILYDIFYPFTWLLYTLKYPGKGLRYFDLLFTVNGSYPQCKRLLKKYKPEAIIFANDHLVIARALLLAANDLGINTFYVQHASVNSYFPPLEFTHAFLDGHDAFEKYKKSGPVKSIVHFVGMAKFDPYCDKTNENTRLRTLGIAYNLVDNVEAVLEVTRIIALQNPGLKFLLRAHPGDTRPIGKIENIEISNATKESSFHFLTRIDALVSGDSSIHLEAAMMNVYPIYYNFTKSKRFDFYGFVQNGLVEYCSDLDLLNKSIARLTNLKPNIQNRATYYNSAIGSSFYGKSTQKIVSIIQETMAE